MNRRHALTLSLCLFPVPAFADHTVFVSSGTDAEVTATVTAFRTAIGATNPNVPGSFLSGRREINWDAVPDTFSAPNFFPSAFLNAGVAPRARGAEFFTPGDGLLLSADSSNPTNTAPLFANMNPSYATEFRFFSAERLFAASNSTTTEVRFFIPGQSATRANVSSFGAIFTDVDIQGSTRIDYYNEVGGILASVTVPPSAAGHGGFSFAGVAFTGGEKVWRVVITCGNTPLGANDDPANGVDVVAMDDFIYSEPVPATNPQMFSASGDIAATVANYRTALGNLNPNTPGSVGSGRREINWDAVPDASSSPNSFPGDFFNGTTTGRARGILFSNAPSFQVSADSDNPAGAPIGFGNIDPSYTSIFHAFSPERLFTAIGSNSYDITFFVPGSTTPADSAGFGAVFADVSLATSSRIDWLDRNGGLLASVYAPVSPAGGFSFLGAKFDSPYRAATVRVTSGTTALGAGVTQNIAGGVDLVVVDDFIYGEPVSRVTCPADVNLDGIVNSADFFDFLALFFAEAAGADIDHNGQINSQDFYVFLTAFFLSC